MIIRKKLVTSILITVILTSVIQVVGYQNNETTTLEITDIRGGICRVKAVIENTGTVDAENFSITISVKGGLFNKTNIFHECSGCDHCETNIPAGNTKSESTLGSAIILGYGRIAIIVTAEAENADLVTQEASGVMFGPLVLII